MKCQVYSAGRVGKHCSSVNRHNKQTHVNSLRLTPNTSSFGKFVRQLLRCGKIQRQFAQIKAARLIGYGIARQEIIDTLQKVRMAFNTGSLAQVAALAALDDEAHVQRTVESNRNESVFLSRELAARGVKFVPTSSNFIFMDLGKPSKDVDAALLRQGIIIRPMAGWGFPTMIRVSIGTHEQNVQFLKALDSVLS